MDIFLDLHREAIQGVVEGFDRLIFKGHLTSLFPQGAFGRYLSKRGILLKEAKPFFEAETNRIVMHAKDAAEREGITDGLVCIFSVCETCTSFAVVGNHRTHRLEAVMRKRKCLHL
jgi:hypothetical protein